MNIDNLKAFLEVESTGSFHKAAENLFITQSSVSARIKILEERLNRKLFTRKRNGTVLTAGGIAFHKHAIAMIKSWERAQQDVALPEGIDDTVCLGIPLNHWSNLSSSWISWMQNNANLISTQIQSDYSVYLMTQIREGLLDLAILYEPHQSPDVVIEEYLKENLVLVSDQPRHVKDGHAAGYIFIDWSQSFRDQHLQAFPGVPSHRLSITLENIALEHVLKYGGSGYFIKNTVEPYIKNGTLFMVEDAPTLSVMTYLVVSAERYNEPAVQEAIKGLKSIEYYKTNSST